MKKTRVQVFSIVALLFMCFIIYKLMDIQLISTENYGDKQVNLLEESVEQRTTEIELSSGRGILLDRNKQPLNNDVKKDIVLFPFIQNIEIPSSIQSDLTEFYNSWEQSLKRNNNPVYLSDLANKDIPNTLYDKISQSKIPGIIAVERTLSNDPSIAAHVQGLVRSNDDEFKKRYHDSMHSETSQPIGISGLEKTFDSFLISENDQKLLYHVDAKGDPLLGLDLRYIGKGDAFYPTNIKTTIDLSMQETVEKIVDEHGIKKGGVVLLDTETNEVLSLASRPKINKEDPYKNNSTKNQMLTTQFPGSVFKTVVAAAALENIPESINTTYNCNLDLYGEEAGERQLGILTFDESFAQSCNYTFATIAKQLVENNQTILEDYAKKLGLLGPVGWSGDLYHFKNFSQLPEEEVGRVWGNSHDPFVAKAIAQTGIGQKEVKVTPLAVANMISTIVNNGVNREIKVVDEILYNNDTTMYKFDSKHSEDGINKETALKLKQLLTDVVDEGTGYKLKGLGVAGKSGTAQIGKETRYNHWFAGYFPKDAPKYAMVVVDLNQTSEHAKTYPVYKDIVTGISEQKGLH